MISGQFLNISSTEGFTLGDLKGDGYPEKDCWGDLMITVLDNFGFAAKDEDSREMKFCWFDDGERLGWFSFDETYNFPNDYFLPKGTTFWVQGKGLSLVGSGAVNFAPVTVTTELIGNTPVANPYPTAIQLKDISVSGYPEKDCWGDMMITILDNFGFAKKDKDNRDMKFCWFDDGERLGWYTFDETYHFPDTYSFPSGTGFWAQGKGLTLEFTFPNTNAAE